MEQEKLDLEDMLLGDKEEVLAHEKLKFQQKLAQLMDINKELQSKAIQGKKTEDDLY